MTICRAQGSMNRVDVFRVPTPETTINLLFFFFLFSDNISMGSTNGEADAAADTAAPKYFGKRRGGETRANNVRCNQPRARKNEAPHTNCTAAAAHSPVLDSDGARCVNSLSLFFFGKWELLRIRFSIDNRWKAERRRITTAENQSANHTAARLLQSE